MLYNNTVVDHIFEGIIKMRVILASKSPRRRELLASLGERLGFSFDIITEEVDESVEDGITPLDAVRILSERKGRAVAQRADLLDAMVISSDTLVELDGRALGKPVDKEDAYSMLSSLSGKGHFVRTGIAVSYLGRVYSDVASTEVVFRTISDREINDYIESGEPMDKAGAYGIQGGAGKYVSEYRGDFDTVVGLSLKLTEQLMKRAAVDFGGMILD